MTKTSDGDYLLVSLLPSSPVTLTSNPAENPVFPPLNYLASGCIQAIQVSLKHDSLQDTLVRQSCVIKFKYLESVQIATNNQN